jgi:uncharacterized membrane protein YfcA
LAGLEPGEAVQWRDALERRELISQRAVVQVCGWQRGRSIRRGLSTMSITHWLLTLFCGSLVGCTLGLIGGGGSILAVPLLLYVVGIRDPHVAIGTSALAVATNASVNLLGHWRAGNVKIPCAAIFAVAGVLGAIAGSTLGKAIDGQGLLLLFSVVMMAVGLGMQRPRQASGDPGVRLNPRIAVRLAGAGLVTGGLSGFFGIGGGFLIVPGLMVGSGMPMLYAIGSSLLSVAAFGFTTAASYAWSGLIDWPTALAFIAGGSAGGLLGIRLATRLAVQRQALARVFATVVILVAIYMAVRTVASWHAPQTIWR